MPGENSNRASIKSAFTYKCAYERNKIVAEIRLGGGVGAAGQYCTTAPARLRPGPVMAPVFKIGFRAAIMGAAIRLYGVLINLSFPVMGPRAGLNCRRNNGTELRNVEMWIELYL